jgi:hypothetical protein
MMNRRLLEVKRKKIIAIAWEATITMTWIKRGIKKSKGIMKKNINCAGL